MRATKVEAMEVEATAVSATVLIAISARVTVMTVTATVAR